MQLSSKVLHHKHTEEAKQGSNLAILCASGAAEQLPQELAKLVPEPEG